MLIRAKCEVQDATLFKKHISRSLKAKENWVLKRIKVSKDANKLICTIKSFNKRYLLIDRKSKNVNKNQISIR